MVVTGGEISRGDLRVSDNGKEQEIASLERIDIPAPAPGPGLPPDTYSNRAGARKRPQVVSMILLDAVNTHYRNQPKVRQAVIDILSQIRPDERVGVFVLGNTLRTLHAFTSDRDSLLAKLSQWKGEVPSTGDFEDLDDLLAPPEDTPPALQAMHEARRITLTLDAIEALANHVKSIPGRKNLLWLSGAFPLVIGMPSGPSDMSRGSPYRYLRTFGREMDRTVAALNAANVAVYPIDSRGLSGSPKAAINQGVMATLADETGGKAFYNRNDIDRSVRLALDDTRQTWLLTYSPKQPVNDGAFHRIRIQTTRAGVRLRYRRGYYAPEPDEELRASAMERLERALSSPLDDSEIGIRVTLNKDAVTVWVDAADVRLERRDSAWTGALRIEMVQAGPTGETFGGIRQTVRLHLPAESYERAMKDGLRFELPFLRDARAVALRIGVLDESAGGLGAVSIPLRYAPRD